MSAYTARDDEDPGTPTHRSRPSIITNASAFAESTMTYGSIMSSDGLARLSQFPPPPGIPFSSLEAAFAVPSSPVASDRSMTPPAGPRRALPPVPSVQPLSLQKTSPRPISPGHISSPTGSVGSRALPQPPLSAAPSSASAYLSPHDWHDGSSSIANDPYGEAVLSTSFITSLLSSSTAGANDASTVTTGPSSYRRNNYEPSVVSNALTVDSTITYPPPKSFPPPLPTDYRYPPVPHSPRSPTKLDSIIDISSPRALNAPPYGYMSAAGRNTPETLLSEESSQIASITGTASRIMSVTPSIQSMTSTTPLIRSFPKGDPILEEDEAKISGPSTPQSRRSRTREQRASTSPSTKTTKSYMSSILGRVSHSSGDRRSLKQATASWFRGKPLPPVPPIPDHAFHEIRKAEDQLPLPDLVNRAATLSNLLDSGHRPYHSTVSLQNVAEQSMPGGMGYGDVRYSGADPTRMHSARGRKGKSGDFSQQPWNQPLPQGPNSPSKVKKFPLTRKRKFVIGLIAIAVIICVTVGVAVGVIVGEKHTSSHSCPGNLTGAACTLDATCVCLSFIGGQCTRVAKSLVDLIDETNTLFNSNLTTDFVSDALWQANVIPSGTTCADQANLIDVAPALDDQTSPNRTKWAQSALLWNLALSENVTATQQLQTFVLDADWQSLGTSDGPTTDSSSKFATQVSGFNFDFAAQTIQVPPVTFKLEGQPTSNQIDQTSAIAESALDRMYSFALASSTQQYAALSHYWTGPLQQKTSSLKQFLSNVQGSPIMLPFDATSAPGQHNISLLLTNSTSTPFPPPLSCYPGLTSTQTQALQELESTVFGLSQAPSASTFDTSCYPDRPVYGVLDLLALRLPFPDGRTGVAKQAALLTRDASSRAVVYSGEVVSALPGAGAPGTPSTDPRRYGTMTDLNHVILQYLRSIPDINTAIQVVEYVLQPAVLPPDNGVLPTLFAALSSLPLIEVAVFGTVDPSDIASTVSSLSDPNNNLFFGTSVSHAVRDWALVATEQGMEWTELATSQKVVQDTSFTNENFNFVLNNATVFFDTNSNEIVGVSNITAAFGAFGLLSTSGLITS